MKLLVVHGLLFLQAVFLGDTADDEVKRIVNGELVLRGEAKFLVSIWNLRKIDPSHLCGGTLIKPGWVLSAAHCFFDENKRFLGPRPWLVVLGENHQEEYEPEEQYFFVQEIFIFPRYKLNYGHSDAALLKLSGEAKMDNYTGTIKVDTNPKCAEKGKTCTTYGWGAEEYLGKGTVLPYKAELTLLDNEECSLAYGDRISEHELCAYEEGKDSCQGDSGGPLVCTCDDDLVLSGIVSGGHGCGKKGYPGIYTRVYSLWKWIKKVIIKANQQYPI